MIASMFYSHTRLQNDRMNKASTPSQVSQNQPNTPIGPGSCSRSFSSTQRCGRGQRQHDRSFLQAIRHDAKYAVDHATRTSRVILMLLLASPIASESGRKENVFLVSSVNTTRASSRIKIRVSRQPVFPSPQGCKQARCEVGLQTASVAFESAVPSPVVLCHLSVKVLTSSLLKPLAFA